MIALDIIGEVISFYLYVCLPISLYLPLSLHLCLSLCLSLYICLSVCTPPCSYSLSSLASVQISYSVSLSVFLFASNSFSLSLTNTLFLYLDGFVCVNLLVAVQKSKRLLQISTHCHLYKHTKFTYLKFLDTVFRSLVVFIFFPFLLFETSPFKRFSASVLIQSTYIGPEDQSVSQTV